jgi:hypothetical protein
MYRRIDPSSRQELPLRMLFQPVGNGIFHRVCEADSFRGLVAAILDDPGYETVDVESRLVERLRVAQDAAFLAEVDGRQVLVSDRNGADTINVASDETLIRSLDRLGFVSVDSAMKERPPA